jgi:DNA repair protein RecN (Recombination protein N)
MLTKIFIKNYILIDELELDFSNGLNIITGETGAGKSILINAIDIAFGAKTGKEVIKTGTDKAIIEITIQNNKQDISKLFEDNGIDLYGSEIILSKEITQTASRSRINGCLVNQEFIKIFRELFLDIHSQHQTYSFLQPKYHITLLDSYIKRHKIADYRLEYEKYRDLLNQLEILKKNSQKAEEQIDFLRFQVEEIENAELNSIK